MDFSAFHAAFDQLSHPAFLVLDSAWETNPSGAALGLEPKDLFEMAHCREDCSICLSDQFYFLSVDSMEDGSTLLILRPDRFLSDQARSIASQLRRSLSPALYAVESLEEQDSIRLDPQASRDLARLNQRLYQIFRLATQLEHCQPYNPLLAQEELIDLPHFLKTFVSENRVVCAQRSMTLTFHSAVPRLVTSLDVQSLQYLLLSLLSNSLGFATQPGQITLTLQQNGDRALITYQDTNPGVSPALLSRFRWNDPDCLSPGRGLGLGLPIVKRLAAALGGTLVQTSSGNDGVGLALSLPIRSTPPSTLHSPELDLFGGYSLSRILLSNAAPASLYAPGFAE